jgi:hypothetical protein
MITGLSNDLGQVKDEINILKVTKEEKESKVFSKNV